MGKQAADTSLEEEATASKRRRRAEEEGAEEAEEEEEGEEEEEKEEEEEEDEEQEDEEEDEEIEIDQVGEEEDEDDDFDDGDDAQELKDLPPPNSEVLQIPVINSSRAAKAYADLIDNSPHSKALEFESGYQPPKAVVEAICRHGNFTSLTLVGGDWEAWLGRFPRLMKRNPHLRRVILSGCPQSGCEGYDRMIYACHFLRELEHLDVSDNYEEMGQAKAVAFLIDKDHPSLRSVNLANNELEDEHLEAVVRAVKKAAQRKTLILESLAGIDLNDKQWLKVLGLRSTEFGDKSNEDILRHLREH
ncbi:Low molecular weight neuronal intermediate filament-like [Balamuthia mandrillaris]